MCQTKPTSTNGHLLRNVNIMFRHNPKENDHNQQVHKLHANVQVNASHGHAVTKYHTPDMALGPHSYSNQRKHSDRSFKVNRLRLARMFTKRAKSRREHTNTRSRTSPVRVQFAVQRRHRPNHATKCTAEPNRINIVSHHFRSMTTTDIRQRRTRVSCRNNGYRLLTKYNLTSNTGQRQFNSTREVMNRNITSDSSSRQFRHKRTALINSRQDRDNTRDSTRVNLFCSRNLFEPRGRRGPLDQDSGKFYSALMHSSHNRTLGLTNLRTLSTRTRADILTVGHNTRELRIQTRTALNAAIQVKGNRANLQSLTTRYTADYRSKLPWP